MLHFLNPPPPPPLPLPSSLHSSTAKLSTAKPHLYWTGHASTSGDCTSFPDKGLFVKSICTVPGSSPESIEPYLSCTNYSWPPTCMGVAMHVVPKYHCQIKGLTFCTHCQGEPGGSNYAFHEDCGVEDRLKVEGR